jgi:urease accessory protein
VSAGWQAELRLGLRHDGTRTILATRAHRGPLVVQRPFYPEGEVCHLYLVHPPGGIVSGDDLRLHLRVGERAHGLVTTPAATKFYRARGGAQASLDQHLEVEDGALEWLPQETLVFDGAVARSRTVVNLTGRARFIGWEVLCLGRPASEETFTVGSVNQDLELWREGSPVLLDHLRLAPGSSLHEPWGLAGHAALGTLIATPATADDVDAARDPLIACTLVDGVLMARTLAAQGETVRRRLNALWQRLRPAILGRPALAPRIWAT